MEKQDSKCLIGAVIERGKVMAVTAGGITVESWDRPGVTAGGLGKAVAGATFAVGDTVYFFLFEDGRGMVIGKA